MNFDYHFAPIQDEKEISILEAFLRLQPLDYSNYQDWVTLAREELLSGYKGAILAINGGQLVGNLVYQPHKDFSSSLMEIKNLRVNFREGGRGLAEFMIKQLEVESRRRGFHALVGDTRTDNYLVISLVASLGFQELARTHLYDLKAQDIIYFKNLIKGSEFKPVGLAT